MSSIDVASDASTRIPEVATVGMKLEVFVASVSDVDRAKRLLSRPPDSKWLSCSRAPRRLGTVRRVEGRPWFRIGAPG